jgi:catechol 2,3-dioxygenase-like lactoylglutathione lyase family enzyme
MSHACIYVLDQDRAKEFYTQKLGFEPRQDVRMVESSRERERGSAGSLSAHRTSRTSRSSWPTRGWATTT